LIFVIFFLYSQLFGAEDPDEAVSPDGEDPENMGIFFLNCY
jgi:hypothetical protein